VVEVAGPLGKAAVLLVFANLFTNSLLLGQIQIRINPNGQFIRIPGVEQNGQQPRADIDKGLVKSLRRAEEFLEKDDFDSVIEIVQRKIIDPQQKRDRSFDLSEDYFADQKMKTSLKREALKLIARLPQEGRRLYELKFGITARQMHDEAVRTRNVSLLQEVARRYFHTEAGYESTYLIGTHKLDHSAPLSAALHFERLRRFPQVVRRWEPMLSLKTAVAWGRAGQPQRSVKTLVALKEASLDGRITLGGRQVPLFTDNGEALNWLVKVLGRQVEFSKLAEEKWTMFRGNPARNAVSAPASPIWDSKWKFFTVRDEQADNAQRLAEVEEQLKQLATENRENGFLTLPSAHPLVIDDLVVFRTMRNLRAVKLSTGEFVWEMIDVASDYDELIHGNDGGSPNRRTTPLELLLKQRSWRDTTAGTLSSDGRYLFAVEEFGFLSPSRPYFRRPQRPLAPKDHNKLMAYDLASGEPMWELGGPRDRHALPLAGTFFLGPPLPLDGRLYCLAETSGEIRLLVLQVETVQTRPYQRLQPELVWSQTLVLPEASLLNHPLRRIAGISPSYSNGVLICPTVAGAVVAVDLDRRVLLWGHRYPQNGLHIQGGWRAARIARALGNNIDIVSRRDNEDRWLDSVPTIVDGRILLTPLDSGELLCMNSVDGFLLWKRPRGEALYLAGVHEQKVILVGRTKVEAVRLSDGQPAWKTPTFIEMPSGRGFQTTRFYHLPLSTGEIATIDLQTGHLIARSKSRTGEVFGNLVAGEGTIVSQSHDKIVGFRSLKELNDQVSRALAKNPDDAEALALRGEMRLHRGERDLALADLRRSIEQTPAPRPRQLIVATLLDQLRTDFSKYRTVTVEIEKQVEDPEQRSEFLRLYADGLHNVGENQAAFQQYIKLTGAGTGKPQLERMNATLSVRSDRWVRPRIAAIYSQASSAERQEMDRALDEQLERAVGAEQAPELLRNFLNSFAELPAANLAGRLFAQRLNENDQVLELELLLRFLRRSGDRESAGFATARLVSLYLQRERTAGVVPLLDELATQYNDMVCLDEKTGRQLVEQWRSEPKVAEILSPKPTWPANTIQAEPSESQVAIPRFFPLNIIGPSGPLVENWTFVLDQRRTYLIARDGQGTERWRLPMADSGGGRPSTFGNSVRFNGHLMIVVLGNRFIVLDTLKAHGVPRVLWRRSLNEVMTGPSRSRPFLRAMRLPGGRRQVVVQDRYGRPIGTVVPIEDQLICYQVGTRLFAADPLTGETLWERRSVARGSDIFGDRKFVFAVPPGSQQAFVFRAADGQQVATRPVPVSGSRLTVQGRHILNWNIEAGRGVLALTDIWTAKTLWRLVFSESSQMGLIHGDEVAVHDPTGRFAVVKIEDGRFRIDEKIERDEGVDSIVVQRSRDRYVLLTHKFDQPGKKRGTSTNPLINGYAYSFDRRTGHKQWTIKIQQQAVELNQPAELPILVLTARTLRPFQKGQILSRNQYAVLILDKRNGKIVHENRSKRPHWPFTIKNSPADKRLDVSFNRGSIALRFTDKPLREPPEAEQPPKND